MKAFYWTMGQYDAIAIVDAPSDEVVSRIVLTVSAAGNIRFQTLRAFTTEEFGGIVAGLP